MEGETSQNQPKSGFTRIELPALISFSPDEPFPSREWTECTTSKEWLQAEISKKCFEERNSRGLCSPEVFSHAIQSFSPNKWSEDLRSITTESPKDLASQSDASQLPLKSRNWGKRDATHITNIDSENTPVGPLKVLNNRDQLKRKLLYKAPDSKSYLEDFNTSCSLDPRNSTPMNALKISPFDSCVSSGQLLNFNAMTSNDCDEWTATIGSSELFSTVEFEEIDKCINLINNTEHEISENGKANFNNTGSTVSMYVTENNLNTPISTQNSARGTESLIARSDLLLEGKKVTEFVPFDSNKSSEFFSTPDSNNHSYDADLHYSNESLSRLDSMDNSSANLSSGQEVDLKNLNEGVLSNSVIYEKLSDILTNRSSDGVRASLNPLDLSLISDVVPTFENKAENMVGLEESIETEKRFKDKIITSNDSEATPISLENALILKTILRRRESNECMLQSGTKENKKLEGWLGTDCKVEFEEVSNFTTSRKDRFFLPVDSDSQTVQRHLSTLEESNCSGRNNSSRRTTSEESNHCKDEDPDENMMCEEESNSSEIKDVDKGMVCNFSVKSKSDGSMSEEQSRYWKNEDSGKSTMCEEENKSSENKDCDEGTVPKVLSSVLKTDPDECGDVSCLPAAYLQSYSSQTIRTETVNLNGDGFRGLPYTVHVKSSVSNGIDDNSEIGEMQGEDNRGIQDFKDHVILKELHVSPRTLLSKKEFPEVFATGSQIVNSQKSELKETREFQDARNAPKDSRSFLREIKVKTEVDENVDKFCDIPSSSIWTMGPVNFGKIENNFFKTEKNRDIYPADDSESLSHNSASNDFDGTFKCADSTEIIPSTKKPNTIRQSSSIKKENTSMQISRFPNVIGISEPLNRDTDNLNQCEDTILMESSEMDTTFASSPNVSADELQCSDAGVKISQRMSSNRCPLEDLFDIDKIVAKAVVKAITATDKRKGANFSEIVKYIKQHKLVRLQSKLNQNIERFLSVAGEVGILKKNGLNYYLPVVSKSSSRGPKRPLIKKVVSKKQTKQVPCKSALPKSVQALKRKATNTPIYSPKFLRNKRVFAISKDDTPKTRIFKKLRSRVIMVKNKP